MATAAELRADAPAHLSCELHPSMDGWTHAICGCGHRFPARRTEAEAVQLWVDHKASVVVRPSPPLE